MMIWIINNWKLILQLALVIIAFTYGYSAGKVKVQSAWDKAKADQVEVDLQRVRDNQEIINSLEKTKNDNNKTISKLNDDLKSTRVRLPQMPSNNCNNTSSGSSDDITSSGAFSERAEEGLATFKSSVDTRALEADQIIEQCRVLRDWANSLNKGN